MNGQSAAEWWIGIDADDTLWHSESYFMESYELFTEVVRPFLVDADVDDADVAGVAHDLLIETERRNIPSFGYGVKGATLSMIEAAITASNGAIGAGAIELLLQRAKTMMVHPVELLDGVHDALDALSGHRLVMITKGDLKDQHRKIDESGLAERFDAIEVVHEKDPHTYAATMVRLGGRLDRFVMVGNSIRSDVAPVVEAGALAVHVPYHTTWAIEAAELRPGPSWTTVGAMRDVPEAIERLVESVSG